MSTERNKKTTTRRQRPATTPEARENQLIAAAVDLAEKQIRNGTASSQVISHYLKLGSSREKLEQERLAKENELLDAKKEALEAQARVEAVYVEALQAMRAYAGQPQELVVSSDEDRDD
jgi:hypothetical protein